MIKYRLVCKAENCECDARRLGREFECWFPSSAAFDEQVVRGLVTCPACDSSEVAKAVMAPSVARADRYKSIQSGQNNEESVPSIPCQEVALADAKLHRLNMMVRELRAKILEQTRDVGADFPNEARKMHAGETQEAPIRGQASVEEARALLEEGIAILPIPILPEDRN